MKLTALNNWTSSVLSKQVEEASSFMQNVEFPPKKTEDWRFSNPKSWFLPDALRCSNTNIVSKDFVRYIHKNMIPILIYNDTITLPNTLPDGIKILSINYVSRAPSYYIILNEHIANLHATI